MTIPDRTTTTPQDVLQAARGLRETIAGRAPEIEAARRLPRDLLDRLIGAGCFRMLLPGTHGGIGADLPSAMRVLETLASADASVAWTVMIGGSSWCDLAGLPRATFDGLFGVGPDVIMAGAINPTGSIAAVDGRYRVSGTWSFASGCEHADWLYGNCVEAVVGGAPQLRVAVFSPDQVAVEDTWTVSGLSGMGSHHFRADDVVVPAERTVLVLAAEPCLDAPIVNIPPPALFALEIASVAIGIAQERWTTLSHSPPTRCPCSPADRSPPTRCSSSSWPLPTSSSAPLGRCCTRPPTRPGRPLSTAHY